MELYLSKLRDVKVPEYGTKNSAGLDFFIPNDFPIHIIPPNGSTNIPSGIKVRLPEGYCLVAFNKSGVALNKDLIIGACVIDNDYQGEIHLHVMNVGTAMVTVIPGEKLVQFLLLPYHQPQMYLLPKDKLFGSKTERGEGRFGSTDG